MIKRLFVLAALICIIITFITPDYQIDVTPIDNIGGHIGVTYLSVHTMLLLFAVILLGSLIIATVFRWFPC